jgi:hypothetical protein
MGVAIVTKTMSILISAVVGGAIALLAAYLGPVWSGGRAKKLADAEFTRNSRSALGEVLRLHYLNLDQLLCRRHSFLVCAS